jgi:hypothetical protein
MKVIWTAVLWIGRLICWPISFYICVTLAANFLTAPIGFKSSELQSNIGSLPWLAVAGFVVYSFAKPKVESIRYRERQNPPSRAASKILALHGDVIEEAKKLCAKENLRCDEFGCPERYREWINDNSQESKIKFEAARRVAETYRPILVRALKDAIGDELMAKLGEAEAYTYPVAGPGHEAVLAYCNLQFDHVDSTLFKDVPKMKEPTTDRQNTTTFPDNMNIEVSYTAGFGVLDPDSGEQYIPGDLRVIVGVRKLDSVTSYYSPWRYQINPTQNTFLKELTDLLALPNHIKPITLP